MKILIVHCDMSQNGGAETYTRDLSNVMAEMGFQTGVLDKSGHSFEGRKIKDLPWLHRCAVKLAGNKFLLVYSIVCRVAPKLAKHYDAVLFSWGEGPRVPTPAIRILHAPVLFSAETEDISVLRSGLGVVAMRMRQLYVLMCRRLAKPDLESRRDVTTIANSRWTATRAAVRHQMIADHILFPATGSCPMKNQAGEANRFVAVGRIVPGKRLEECVQVIRALRSQGTDAELEIVGRVSSAYGENFVTKFRDEPGVRILQNASEADKTRALEQARFGLHCFRNEHFGIAVAEMIRHGTVPLVFAGGGVTELVPDADLQFADDVDLLERANWLADLPDGRVQEKITSLQENLGRICQNSVPCKAKQILSRWQEEAF